MRVLLILSHSQLVQGRSWDDFFFFGKSHASKLGPKDWEVYWYTGYSLHVVQRGTGKFSNCCLYGHIDVCIYIYTHIRLDFDREACFFCWSSNSFCRIEVASHDSWYYYPCHNSQKLCCRCCRPRTNSQSYIRGMCSQNAKKTEQMNKKWCVFACELTNSEKTSKTKKFCALVSFWVRLWVHNYICSICSNSPWIESPSLGKINGGRKMIPSFQRRSLVSFSECMCMGQPIGFP